MRKIFTLILALTFVLGMVGCNSQNEFSIDEFDLSQTYPEAPGTLETIYDELSGIVKDAEVIARVSINGSTEESIDGYPQINTSAKVLETLKGDVSANNVLTIVEEGSGETVLGGIPLLNSSNEYVLFLTQYEGKYYICGAFQGRFIIEQDYVFQQATEDVKLKNYQPLKYTDFANEINP